MYMQGLKQHEPANVSCLPVQPCLLILHLCLLFLRVEKLPSTYTCVKVRVRMCMHACSVFVCVYACVCVCMHARTRARAHARTHTHTHTHTQERTHALLKSSYIRRVPLVATQAIHV